MDTIGVMSEVASDMTFINALNAAAAASGGHIISENPVTALGRGYLDALSDGYILQQAAEKIDAGTSTVEEQGTFKAIADQIKAATAAQHGTAGPAYLDSLTAMIAEAGVEAVTELLADRCRAFVSAHTPAGADGQVSRVVQKFALVAAAGCLAVEMGILPFTTTEITEAVVTCVTAWLQQRGTTGSKEDEMMISRVRAFIAEFGDSRFAEQHFALDTRLPRAAWTERRDHRVIYHFQADVFAKLVAPMSPREAIATLHARGHAPADKVERISVRRAEDAPSRYPITTTTMPAQARAAEALAAEAEERASQNASRPRCYSIYETILDSE